eukprot:3402577-Pyramimonas_sp.AAC.1
MAAQWRSSHGGDFRFLEVFRRIRRVEAAFGPRIPGGSQPARSLCPAQRTTRARRWDPFGATSARRGDS